MPPPQITQLKPPADTVPSAGVVGAPGSTLCTVNKIFELGKRIPRITCAMFPAGGKEGACAAFVAGFGGAVFPVGQVIFWSAASSAASSVRPVGNLPTC